MLDVDVNALSLWLERDALPQVSDADPSALAEYILALLDTIDLSQLSDAAKADTASALSDLFDSHTEPFVDSLFAYIRTQRAKAATPTAPPTTASRGEQRGSRRSSRSRSPARGRSRSISRSRSGERERESRRRARGGGEEGEGKGGHGQEPRRGSGTLLIRDDRYGIKQVIRGGGGGGAGRREGRGDYHDGRDRDGGRMQGAGGYQQGHRQPPSSAPLIIARPYVPPSDATLPSQRLSRSVHLPASNPYDPSPSSAPNPSFPSDTSPANVAHVGRHTVVKRKRTEESASDGVRSGGVGVLVVNNAPRFVLSMRLLTDHFSQFGALKGVEINEEEGTAEVRYATQAEAVQAALGRPPHPSALLTLKTAESHQRYPLAPAEELVEEAADAEGEEQTANGEEDGNDDSGFGAAEKSAGVEVGPSMAVGRHTLTLKARPPAPPPDARTFPVEVDPFYPSALATMAPAVPTAAPTAPSALHTAELIRQRKAAEQPPSAAASAAPPTSAAAPVLSEAERVMKKSRVKMELLQKQIDQGQALVERLSEVMKTQGLKQGSEGYEEMERKRAELEMSLEDTRKRWRQERGNLVRMSLAAAGPPAAGAVPV